MRLSVWHLTFVKDSHIMIYGHHFRLSRRSFFTVLTFLKRRNWASLGRRQFAAAGSARKAAAAAAETAAARARQHCPLRQARRSLRAWALDHMPLAAAQSGPRLSAADGTAAAQQSAAALQMAALAPEPRRKVLQTDK